MGRSIQSIKRSRDMFELYHNKGVDMASIGRAYGISRERVRQIIMIYTMTEGKEILPPQREGLSMVMKWSKLHKLVDALGISRKQVALVSGINAQTVSRFLNSELRADDYYTKSLTRQGGAADAVEATIMMFVREKMADIQSIIESIDKYNS